jgi:hypothetical protein
MRICGIIGLHSSIGPATGWRGSDHRQRTPGIAGGIGGVIDTSTDDILRDTDIINSRVLLTIICICRDKGAAVRTGLVDFVLTVGWFDGFRRAAGW